MLAALSGISIIPLLVPAGSGNIVAKRENPAEIGRVGQSVIISGVAQNG